MKNAETTHARAGRTGTVAAVLLVLLVVGCRRSESRVATGEPPAGSKTPAPEKEEPPRIRDAAESGLAPFEGLKEPRDAAVDSRGRIWVADFGHSRLRIFDRDGGYLGGWGGRGNGTYGFQDPCAVAIRGTDVYVADTWNGRVEHFSLSGEPKGTAAGLFGPRGVAVGADGRVWVTDTGNNQVRSYDSALANFEAIGKRGSGPGEFSSPVGIAGGSDGRIYVADIGNRRIEVLDAKGRFERNLSVPGWEGAAEPFLDVADSGAIYVSDPNGGKVLELATSGELRNTWSAGEDGKPFARPTGVALDSGQGVLYVVNSASNLVSKVRITASEKP
jgi:DNA-binding beta-propeller fold protein YncE